VPVSVSVPVPGCYAIAGASRVMIASRTSSGNEIDLMVKSSFRIRDLVKGR
jgi:hypothetical protein